MSSHDWNEDETLRLIDNIRDRSVLWSVENEHYKNRTKRSDAFKEISERMSIPRDEIERKWKVLQTQFRREQIKIGMKGIKSNNGTEHVYRSHWFGYKHMAFLKARNNARTSRETSINQSPAPVNNINNGNNNEDESQASQSSAYDEMHVEDTKSGILTNQNFIKEPNKVLLPPTRRRNCCKEFDPHIDGRVRVIKYADKRPCRDDAAVYGEHIANKLRKYNMFIRAQVEHSINCVLHEADMKSLQQNDLQSQSSFNSQQQQQQDTNAFVIRAATPENSQLYHFTEMSPSVSSVASSTSALSPYVEGQEQ